MIASNKKRQRSKKFKPRKPRKMKRGRINWKKKGRKKARHVRTTQR